MSRTYRSREVKGIWLRHPQTFGIVKTELKALEELSESGFNSTNRHTVRGNPKSDAIPSAWDDRPVSGCFEDWKIKNNKY